MMGWIDKTERLPDRHTDGAGHNGCVLAWHRYQGCVIAIAERVADSSFLTHWMQLPSRPEGMDDKTELPPWRGQ